jgi:hypothetical protein
MVANVRRELNRDQQLLQVGQVFREHDPNAIAQVAPRRNA